MSSEGRIPIIVCVGESGRAVVYGWADSYPAVGDEVVLHDARMVLRWDVHGLLGLAAEGPAGDTRITYSVARTSAVAAQIIEVSPEAATAIASWPTWRG